MYRFNYSPVANWKLGVFLLTILFLLVFESCFGVSDYGPCGYSGNLCNPVIGIEVTDQVIPGNGSIQLDIVVRSSPNNDRGEVSDILVTLQQPYRQWTIDDFDGVNTRREMSVSVNVPENATDGNYKVTVSAINRDGYESTVSAHYKIVSFAIVDVAVREVSQWEAHLETTIEVYKQTDFESLFFEIEHGRKGDLELDFRTSKYRKYYDSTAVGLLGKGSHIVSASVPTVPGYSSSHVPGLVVNKTGYRFDDYSLRTYFTVPELPDFLSLRSDTIYNDRYEYTFESNLTIHNEFILRDYGVVLESEYKKNPRGSTVYGNTIGTNYQTNFCDFATQCPTDFELMIASDDAENPLMAHFSSSTWEDLKDDTIIILGSNSLIYSGRVKMYVSYSVPDHPDIVYYMESDTWQDIN